MPPKGLRVGTKSTCRRYDAPARLLKAGGSLKSCPTRPLQQASALADIAVGLFDLVAGFGQPPGDLAGDHHRAVMSAGTAE